MSLIPSWTWGDLDLTDAPFLFAREGDGFNPGAPVTATEALAQLLQDGEIEIGSRASNRTLEFTVYIDEPDLLASADAERLLALEADKPRNTLTFDPGDEYAPATVFDTFRAQLTFVRSDEAEVAGFRRYDVSMKAAPFGRSANVVTSVALEAGTTTEPPPAPIDIQINPALDLPGWSARIGTIYDPGAGLRISGSRTPRWRYQGGSIPLADTRFLSLLANCVPANATVGTNFLVPPTLTVDGIAAEFVAAAPVSATVLRYYWRSPATSGTVFEFGTNFTNPNDRVSIADFRRTNTPPTWGTARQKQRSLDVAGSARTEGSLSIQHESSPLGSTLIYTWPGMASSYSPPLRRWRTSGGTLVTDSTLVSGAYDTIDTPLIFDIPVGSLISGTHLLMARLRSDVASEQSITYTAQLRIGSSDVGLSTTGTTPVAFGSSAWRNVVLARIMLPPTDVPMTSSATVRLTVVATSPVVSDIDLDEAWLFNSTVGDLSWVECPDSRRLWLNSASVAEPRPTIYRGNEPDATDAAYPGSSVMAFGAHRLTPGLMNVFSATSGALDAGVALTHQPSWHTHAAI